MNIEETNLFINGIEGIIIQEQYICLISNELMTLKHDKIIKAKEINEDSVFTKAIFINGLKTVQADKSHLTIEIVLDSIYVEYSQVYMTERVDKCFICKYSIGKCTNFVHYLYVSDHSKCKVKCFALGDFFNHAEIQTVNRIPKDVYLAYFSKIN